MAEPIFVLGRPGVENSETEISFDLGFVGGNTAEAAPAPVAIAPGPFESGWPVVGAWDQPWR